MYNPTSYIVHLSHVQYISYLMFAIYFYVLGTHFYNDAYFIGTIDPLQSTFLDNILPPSSDVSLICVML